MWDSVKKISEEVSKYSTRLGQLWYLCVFVFRLIVVVTIGGAVYADEQSAFKCSNDIVGCTIMCFNVFSKISHMRFWAFQLLAVIAPIIFFHFYSADVTGQIEKLKNEREALNVEEGEIDAVDNPKMERSFKKMSRRKKSIGNVKVKKVYSGGDLKEVLYTRKIHFAYYISVIFRLATEAISMYFSYGLFKFMDPSVVEEMGTFDFLWLKVPGLFKCTGDDPDVIAACHPHVAYSKGGMIPCWVSRPWEKTMFLRYMNILSAICFLLCAFELVYLTAKGMIIWKRRARQRFFTRGPYPRQDYVFCVVTPNGHHLHHDNLYPITLAVPTRLSSRYLGSTDKTESEKKVQITGDDEVIEGEYLGSRASAKKSASNVAIKKLNL